MAQRRGRARELRDLQQHAHQQERPHLGSQFRRGAGRGKDLARWADIVTESFSPGTMSRRGLGYESLRQVKPDIIMLSTCPFGQIGPLSQVADFGTMGSALAGFVSLVGEGDRRPVGP